MKPIELNSVLTFAFCFGILIMSLFIIVFYLKEWGNRQLKNDLKAEYETMYLEIQENIKNYAVDLSNYYEIKKQIWRLENLKWQNREKTAILRAELVSGRFLKIADGIAKNRVNKNV